MLLDVKPWDDETDMKKLEEAVRSVQMEGLLWGACMSLFKSSNFVLVFVFLKNVVIILDFYYGFYVIHILNVMATISSALIFFTLFCVVAKLVPVGYGIKKLQIMMTIVDDLVSVDDLIENYLTVEPWEE